MSLKLVHSSDSPKALGMKIAKSNKSITNGAIAHYGPIVKADYQEGIVGHIEWTASPLVIAARNVSRISLRGLRHNTTYEEQAKALKAIREIMAEALSNYQDLLEIKRTDHEGE
jgi:hypothetical protein